MPIQNLRDGPLAAFPVLPPGTTILVPPRSVVRLLLVLAGFVLSIPAAHAQIEELPRPDTADVTTFGVSVAVGDSLAVVGASGETVCGENAGAVYVYERTSGSDVTAWALTARLVPHPCRPNAFFGARLALSGSRVLVSASSEHFADEGENAAFVFERDSTGTWHQGARLTGDPEHEDGLFAAGVALDGNRAVVSTTGDPDGAYGGAVYVFEHNPTTGAWEQTARLSSSKPLDSGILGGSVSLDGPYLAVAASTYLDRTPGSVYVFRHDPDDDAWHLDAHLTGIDGFFIALDLSDSTLVVGEERAGANGSGVATVYSRTDTTWTKSTALRPSLPYESGGFGSVVSLDGPWALITGYDEQLGKEFNIDRVVYVFQRRRRTVWRERTILDIGEVDFGAALDQNGRTAIISSVPESEPGAVYVVRLP